MVKAQNKVRAELKLKAQMMKKRLMMKRNDKYMCEMCEPPLVIGEKRLTRCHLYLFHSDRSDEYLINMGYIPDKLRNLPKKYNMTDGTVERLKLMVIENVKNVVREDRDCSVPQEISHHKMRQIHLAFVEKETKVYRKMVDDEINWECDSAYEEERLNMFKLGN